LVSRTSGSQRRSDAKAQPLEFDLAEILSQVRVRLATLCLASEGIATPDLALADTIRFALAHVTVQAGEETPVPASVLSSVREAANRDAPVELLLRCCFAVHSFVDDHILRRAAIANIPSLAVRDILAGQANVFGRLSDVIVEEYGRWNRDRPKGPADRALRLVAGTLAGRFPTGPIFNYPLTDFHMAGVAVPEAMAMMEQVIARKGLTRLSVCASPDVTWFWIHAQNSGSAYELMAEIERVIEGPMAVGLGEPGAEVHGWRRSHQQARAAFDLALEWGAAVVRYRQVALLAAAKTDPLLAESLTEIYLKPLRSSHDQKLDLVSTLREYFRADRNRASAAAALGISRQAISHRLGLAEERLREPLRSCGLSLETALLLDQVGEFDFANRKPVR